MHRVSRTYHGFTLVEILVVVSIIAILSGVLLVNFSDSSAASRDAKRQADLRNLQNAIELYKNKHGRYPAGCNGPDNWSGQVDSNFACPFSANDYIRGHAAGISFAPEFIRVLPIDPRPVSGDQGYVYTVNGDGSVYKLMAMNVVESETVNYRHEFASCSMGPAAGVSDVLPSDAVDGFNNGGLCSFVESPLDVDNCRLSTEPTSPGNGRFDNSYGLWGGIASTTIQRLENTISTTDCDAASVSFNRRTLAGIDAGGAPVNEPEGCRANLYAETASIICK
jgi:prepilin-type N-terminal cleavage/methylation domain-containing protein